MALRVCCGAQHGPRGCPGSGSGPRGPHGGPSQGPNPGPLRVTLGHPSPQAISVVQAVCSALSLLPCRSPPRFTPLLPVETFHQVTDGHTSIQLPVRVSEMPALPTAERNNSAPGPVASVCVVMALASVLGRTRAIRLLTHFPLRPPPPPSWACPCAGARAPLFAPWLDLRVGASVQGGLWQPGQAPWSPLCLLTQGK